MAVVGKRIYYDTLSGSVIQTTSEMSGDVVELTADQERAIYISLSERSKGSYSFVQLDYGQYRKEFMDGVPTHVNPATKEISWTWRDPESVTEQKTLEQEIVELKAELARSDARFADIEMAIVGLYGGAV